MQDAMMPPLLERMGVEDAIQAAADHADRVHDGWTEAAFQTLVRFVRKGLIFRAEDVRNFAATTDLPEPPDRRAWGSVLQRASREKLIVRIGYAPCQNKGSHNRPTTLWQAT